MSEIPENIIKAARDLQTAFRQDAGLASEIEELKQRVEGTDEWAEVEEMKIRKKELQEANEAFQKADEELKAARKTMHGTAEYQDLKAARKNRKDFQQSIKDVARDIVKEVTGRAAAGIEQ